MSVVADIASVGGMSTRATVSPVLTLRRGLLLVIAVCLLFHFVLFSGYFDLIWQRFVSGEVFFVVGVLVETLCVFCILYRTPMLRQTTGRLAGVGRVVGLVV